MKFNPVEVSSKDPPAISTGDDALSVAIQSMPFVRDPTLPPLDILLSEQNLRPDEGYM